MTYRERLNKYKDGTLSEEEKLMIEQELEKSEAINDYLAEELEKSLRQGVLENDDLWIEQSRLERTTSKKTTIEKSISKTVNRRLAAVIAISVLCVFIIIFMDQRILSPLIASQFYNPTRKTAGQKYFQDFANDIRAITEVSVPGVGIVGLPMAENLGFGKYTILYQRENLLTKETVTVNAQLDKSRRIGYFNDFYDNRLYVAFTEFWGEGEGSKEYDTGLKLQKDMTKVQIDHVRELPPTTYIAAWVRFTDDLTLEELCKLKSSYQEIDFKWLAIRTAQKQGQQLMGFSTDPNDNFVTGDKVNKDKYPGFQLIDLKLSLEDTSLEAQMAKNYETHYTSLLKYLVDHQEAVTTLVGETSQYDYKSALTYTQKSGISTYGALIYGERDDLLALYDDGQIMTFTIDNMMISKYIN